MPGFVGFFALVVLIGVSACGQSPTPAPTPRDAEGPKVPEVSAPDPAAAQRAQLNLLGQTDSDRGESRRNENQQFNAMDTNTIKELNVRLGTTATIVPQFKVEDSYLGSEFGTPPVAAVFVRPIIARPNFNAAAWWTHSNSVTSARAFFQVGGVRPARENDYGFQLGWVGPKKIGFSLDGRQQRVRGQVNGNVLVPLPAERTPLTTEPELRAIVEQYLSAYPQDLPNRTDVDPRMLNTNAPQSIDTDAFTARMDIPAGERNRVTLSHAFVLQQILAFQLVGGQNPNTDIRSNSSRAQWTRTAGRTVWSGTAGYDRVVSFIRPDASSVGPTVSFGSALTSLSPAPPIPILRTLNRYRAAVQWSRQQDRHTWRLGGEVTRNDIAGREQDGERGIVGFNNDFGRDAITNLRLGTPSSYVVALGYTHRGYRNWFVHGFAGDTWRVSSRLTLDYGVRYEIATRPTEVQQLDELPYPCDCNNVAPRFGFAYRLGGWGGVIRGAYGLHYGEIFATLYGQIRWNPPWNYRIAIPSPNLADPLGGLSYETLPPDTKSGAFLISPELRTPYSHQYNFSWETGSLRSWRMQLGYVGSRSQQLFQMWFENRAYPVPGVPLTTATINLRRPDPNRLEVFRLLNSSRGYYDAGRVTVLAPRWYGLGGEISYWFGKALDLGNDYTSTLAGVDARQGRSQFETNVHQDLKARSSFDQPHALLARLNYDLPEWPASIKRSGTLGRWSFTGVALAKSGTPFSVETGSDAPGFGNVDGQGGDRPHLLRTEILGATVGHPDTSRATLDRTSFAFLTPGQLAGSLGRNAFRRGKIANINASLTGRWTLPRQWTLQFRAESINLLNTPQFSEPTRELASPSFGRIVNTLNDGRAFRFQLRLQI